MDEDLRKRHEEATQRIAAERAKRGIVSAGNVRRKQAAERKCGTAAPRAGLESLAKLLPDLLPVATPEEAEAERVGDARRARQSLLDSWNAPVTSGDRALLIADKLKDGDEWVSYAHVREWLAGDKPWLLLLGTTGRGKTLAALWAAMKLRGKYVGAREFERIVSARYGDEVDDTRSLMNCHMLVIDDAGRERDAAAMTSALLDMVDHRRGRQRSILIANMTPKRFKETYPDERLHSRLAECADICKDAGVDMRRQTP